MSFRKFKDEVAIAFNEMAKGELFITNTPKDLLWDTYLESYDEEERQIHNCNACKAFITHYGKVVTINPETLEMETFWDNVHVEGYETVAKNLATLIKNSRVNSIFLRSVSDFFGANSNIQRLPDGTITTWYHLYVTAPKKYLIKTELKGAKLNDAETSAGVLLRSLTEFKDSAFETVLDLIESGNLYRGTEFVASIKEFLELKREESAHYKTGVPITEADIQKRINFCYLHNNSHVCKLRNTAIGTLLVNLSEDMDLETAVKKYETIMAPTNYKRPNALITKKQVDAARKTVQELGLEESIPRRHARIDDISVNNVLFVNRDTRNLMQDDVFGKLKTQGFSNMKAFKNSEEINASEFLENVLPNSKEVEVLLTNDLIPNLVTLTAPVNKDAKPLFKWNNNFAWCYNGSVADSFKEKIKSAGGCVEGYLRCSLHWFNFDDLDIHITQPNGCDIFFGDKRGYTGGVLDVDMNAGGGHSRDAVENIVWKDPEKLCPGIYTLKVHNYCKRETSSVGFECEIEYNDELYKFNYEKAVKNAEFIEVAKITVSNDKTIIVTPNIPCGNSVKSTKVWNLDTMKFQRVSCIMESPNQWDLKYGNKHLFFMLEGCKNPEPVRGFFNEYLKDELTRDHKRVFEALGSESKSPYREEQLSGIGFSDTTKGELIIKVDNKTYKIKF